MMLKQDMNGYLISTYRNLGDNGMIRAGDGHSCDDCTHKYKATADTIRQDGTAVIATEEVDAEPVKLVVVDGIVMGPKVRFLFVIKVQ